MRRSCDERTEVRIFTKPPSAREVPNECEAEGVSGQNEICTNHIVARTPSTANAVPLPQEGGLAVECRPCPTRTSVQIFAKASSEACRKRLSSLLCKRREAGAVRRLKEPAGRMRLAQTVSLRVLLPSFASQNPPPSRREAWRCAAFRAPNAHWCSFLPRLPPRHVASDCRVCFANVEKLAPLGD